MKSLEQAVALIGQWGPERAKDRQQILSRIDGLSSSCSEAINIWQRYLDAPGAAGDEWTILSWVGPERAKRLHEINLEASELLRQAGAIAGPEAVRFHAYENDLVEMAYRRLTTGETGPDVARSAIERMHTRRAYLNQVAARIKAIQLVRPKAVSRGAASSRLPAKKVSLKKVPVKKAKKTRPAAGSLKKASKKKAGKTGVRPAKKSARKSAKKRR